MTPSKMIRTSKDLTQSLASPPYWLLGCVTLLMGLLFVSGDSFWIDEGNAAGKALQSSIQDWYQALVSQGGSDAQMPGYMLYIWAWEKIFGSGEYALRASNIPWLLLAVFHLRRVPFLWLALLVSPFTLYYVSELRPYMMQIGASAMILGSFIGGGADPARRWRVFLLGNFLLCASSLTGVLWSAGALLAFLGNDPSLLRNKSFWRDLAISSPLFLGLGVYYLKTLLLGQGAALMGGGVLPSLAACGYELSGLMGLGPGRIELRDNPASVKGYVIPLATGIAVLGSAYLCGVALVLKRLSRRQRMLASLAILAPLAALLALILLKDFRLLARHIAPLAPLVALPVSALLGVDWRQGRKARLGVALSCLALCVCLYSASSLRFAERHRKDAYREAAAYSEKSIATGKTVFWAADAATAHYYGLGTARPGFIFIKPDGEFREIAKPGVVILSKPDIYDPKGALRDHLESVDFIRTRNYQAFTIYE